MLARLRTIALIAMLGVVGCAHSPTTVHSDRNTASAAGCDTNPIAACWRQPARYPSWLVGMLDPAAPLVGRTIALVRFRPGYLEGDEAARGVLGRALEPMDILLASSKGRLTGHTIPGLFTHTIIYLGTQAQLRRLGLWQDPAVVPFHDAIDNGMLFVESDQKGVHLSTSQMILDADRMLVLRPRIQTPACLRRAVPIFFDHVGSRFDFHFNAGEPKRLYCSELVYHVLPELKLPVRHFYNRDVVLPDDIAATGLESGTRLSFVLYLKGGAKGWTPGSLGTARADLAAEWLK